MFARGKQTAARVNVFSGRDLRLMSYVSAVVAVVSCPCVRWKGSDHNNRCSICKKNSIGLAHTAK